MQTSFSLNVSVSSETQLLSDTPLPTLYVPVKIPTLHHNQNLCFYFSVARMFSTAKICSKQSGWCHYRFRISSWTLNVIQHISLLVHCNLLLPFQFVATVPNLHHSVQSPYPHCNVTTSTSNWKWKSLSHVWLFVTPWAIQSMQFFRPGFGVGGHSLLQGIFPT